MKLCSSFRTKGNAILLICVLMLPFGTGCSIRRTAVNMVWDALSHYWGGPKLTESPLLRLQIVQDTMAEHGNNPTKALRHILGRAVEQQRPEGERSMTTAEWILYNILELKFIQGQKVRDVARRLAMSESDLYRKQRVAIEEVAKTLVDMEQRNST